MYAIPYILFLIVMGGLAFYAHTKAADDKAKQQIFVCCFALFVVFFGFRGFVFNDWRNYYEAFRICSFENVYVNAFTSRHSSWIFEPGFTLLMASCKAVVDNYYFFNLVCTVLNTVLLFRFLRHRSDNLPFALVLYLTFGGFIISINLMRNALSVFIFINALRFITDRKPYHYFALCLAATMFHFTALLFFPLYFFLHRNINKWLLVAVFVGGNVVFLAHIPLFLNIVSLVIGADSGQLADRLEFYTSGTRDEATALSIGYLERVFTSVLIFCYYDKLKALRKDNALFINSFVIFFIFFFYFSEFRQASQRLANIFAFAYWILWADLLRCMAIENNRRLFIAFIAVYCLLKTYGTTNMQVAEYDNILFGAKPYEERLYLYNRYYDGDDI